MELRGRWGLVTGAAKRIGRSIALALAGRGLNVIVHYKASADAAAATVREIEALGVRALALRADLDTVQSGEMDPGNPVTGTIWVSPDDPTSPRFGSTGDNLNAR